MKQGNQFYLMCQLSDANEELLDINSVEKILFTIKDLIKIYDGENNEVSYDENKKCFKIWLTEDETFEFEDVIKIDARILFRENTEHKKAIGGTDIVSSYWRKSLSKENLDVKEEKND